MTVAWGDKERLTPAKARRREELPGHARFVTLADCGHSPMWDDPELVAGTILEGTDARSTTDQLRVNAAAEPCSTASQART